MKRFLMSVVLALLIAVPAVAEESVRLSDGFPETESKVEAEAASAPQCGGDEEQLVEISLDQLFGGLSFLAKEEDPEGLCIVCPLTYCRRPGLRCDYVGCPQQTCCTFSCYYDLSCTTGNRFCRTFDCGCGLIITLP